MQTVYSGNATPMSKIYIMMNKPAGAVCSSVSDSHQTVYQLLPEEYQQLLQAKRGDRLHTVGRLDADTTGLLLITTDGQFSNHLTRHENNISKTYRVTLRDSLTPDQQTAYIQQFSRGLSLPAEKKAPVQFASSSILEFSSPDTCSLTITQGLFHQVKRMFLAMGNQVTALHRTKIGEFTLDESLKPGQWKLINL